MPTPVTERDAIVATFAEVAEQSFFAYAEPADPAPDDLAACTEWIDARVSFTGPFAGSLTVTLPASLAYELCGSFLGYGPEDPLARESVDDMAGELANMACGAWLTAAQGSHVFALAHPDVNRVSGAPPSPLVWLACNGQPVGVTLESTVGEA